MLEGMVSKNAIKDQCIEFFGPKGKAKEALMAAAGAASDKETAGKKIVVDKTKFRDWWIEAKSDHFEIIKYYLIGWMSRQIKAKKIDPETSK